jgi:hypothetical protein
VPVACEFGLSDCVTEAAPRIDYLDALTALTQASAILLMGSSEPHYTASKLYPALLARRPILSVFHEKSSVVSILSGMEPQPHIRVVTYSDTERAESQWEQIYASLVALLGLPRQRAASVDVAAMKEFSANVLAGKLAAVFEQVRRAEKREALAT